MKLIIARLISSLFHPVIFATVVPFILLHNITKDIFLSIRWMFYSAAFIILALFVYFILRPNDFIHDFDISDRKKRPMFYFILLVISFVYFIIALTVKGIFFPLTIASAGVILAIILFEIVNRYIKVSIHVAIATAFIITYGMFHGPILFFAICWIPFAVMWSRIRLKKHKVSEAIVGMTLGAVITIFIFAIGKWLI